MAASVSSRVWVLRWLLGAFAHWVWLRQRRQRRYDDGFVTYTWQSTLTSASSVFFPFLLILSLATSPPSSVSLSLSVSILALRFFCWISLVSLVCMCISHFSCSRSLSITSSAATLAQVSFFLYHYNTEWENTYRGITTSYFSLFYCHLTCENIHIRQPANTPCTRTTQRDAICTERVCVPVFLCAYNV